jgi:hypothetical protein
VGSGRRQAGGAKREVNGPLAKAAKGGGEPKREIAPPSLEATDAASPASAGSYGAAGPAFAGSYGAASDDD